MSLYVVTGGAGLLGSHLVAQLVSGRNRVRVVDNFTSGAMLNIASMRGLLEMRMGDICRGDFMIDAFKGADIAFHFAAQTNLEKSWQYPDEVSKVNINGTLMALRACAANNVKRLVFASCGSVYGRGEAILRNEQFPLSPATPLAISKLCAERYCLSWGERHEFEVVCLRFFEPYGPASINGSHLLAGLVHRARAGEELTLSDAVYDFVHVDDIVRASVAAAEVDGIGGSVINVGSGVGHTQEQVVSMLNKLLEKPVERASGPLTQAEAPYNVADISLAAKKLDYVPLVPLQGGLTRMVKGANDG